MVFDIHVYVLYLFSAIALFFFTMGIMLGRTRTSDTMAVIIALIGGMMWISLWSLADNIEVQAVEDIEYTLGYPMNVTTSDASVSLQTANFGLAERPVNTASVLYNMKISCISIDLSKTGTPTGLVTFGIMGGTNNIIKSFGTFDIATEITTTQRTWTKCLPNHDYWQISLYDKVAVYYPFGTAGNGLNVYTTTTQFDGINSVRATLSSAGTWTDSTTTDVRMILIDDQQNIIGQAHNYSLGSAENANAYVRIYMLSFGVVMLFIGVFQGRIWQ